MKVIGGVFEYIGRFKNRILSHYSAYATHRSKTVVITTKRNIVTPVNPEEFVQFLKGAIENNSNAMRIKTDLYGVSSIALHGSPTGGYLLTFKPLLLIFMNGYHTTQTSDRYRTVNPMIIEIKSDQLFELGFL